LIVTNDVVHIVHQTIKWVDCFFYYSNLFAPYMSRGVDLLLNYPFLFLLFVHPVLSFATEILGTTNKRVVRRHTEKASDGFAWITFATCTTATWGHNFSSIRTQFKLQQNMWIASWYSVSIWNERGLLSRFIFSHHL